MSADTKPWGNYYRVIVVLVGFLCLTSICSNYIIINFTFICMKNDMSNAIPDSNGTLKSIYDYSSGEKKWILWAVALGTMIGTLPINVLYVKFGARFPFFLAGLTSIISTALIPWAAGFNYWILILLRFIQVCDFGPRKAKCILALRAQLSQCDSYSKTANYKNVGDNMKGILSVDRFFGSSSGL
ncbi:hypothetical protein L3Y34_007086 [Caenorhabditis briggsae]|uniref:Uncharacterized protein n=1 Tax=Caenorhabditis briggsae TaxID=6238 RepID=A0AAE9A5L1_CAEBR|nr:hypothetical protein L3Y34_007086 [Caenorhabditis briggsae]